MSEGRTALLLIAHGSRRAEANADLEFIAAAMRERGRYPIVRTAFLELVEPGIEAAVADCVRAGAVEVILLPYFLSPGIHVVEDLAATRDRMQTSFPAVRFMLVEPLGRHPLLVEIVAERAGAVEGT